MDIILIAGLWLTADAWDTTARELEARGHRATPLPLPGVDDGDRDATLDDQIEAVLAAVDRAVDPVVVGHSAAATLAWLAADRRPDRVARAVMIGGFPTADGAEYANFFEIGDAGMPFPGWEPFDGPDSADLDEVGRDRIAAAAVPVPTGVAAGTVRLTDERRFAVPVTVVCPEFGPDDIIGWVESGDIPELVRGTGRAGTVEYVDVDSGHWPMFTCPTTLADVLDRVVTGEAR